MLHTVPQSVCDCSVFSDASGFKRLRLAWTRHEQRSSRGFWTGAQSILGVAFVRSAKRTSNLCSGLRDLNRTNNRGTTFCRATVCNNENGCQSNSRLIDIAGGFSLLKHVFSGVVIVGWILREFLDNEGVLTRAADQGVGRAKHSAELVITVSTVD